MLIGCTELKLLCGIRAIVEGDSQLAILRGSSGGEYPWLLANWVEEIHSLYASLSLSFQHVVHESNVVADALARADASCTRLAFDV